LPTSGKIIVDGHDIVHEKVKAAKNIGWVPELPNFEPNAKPVALMKYFAGFYDLDGINVNKRIMELLDSVGLSDHLNKKLMEYSQGMKKRFAIAESLIGDPNNVLFDETLNGLDPEGVKFVRNLIIELKKNGKAILLSSHILGEIENLADMVAIIHHGKLIKDISKQELTSLGKTVIHIQILNMDENLKAILHKFGEVMEDGNEVVISDLKVDDVNIPGILNELISQKYIVKKFEPSGESLEEYFFRLIGDNQ
jgi:ABC-2 type transport system ATP-binding protein